MPTGPLGGGSLRPPIGFRARSQHARMYAMPCHAIPDGAWRERGTCVREEDLLMLWI